MLPLPIAIAYTTPSTLGRDRIAAVAGAHALFPGREILVVDAGTAVTYDRLTPDGTFAGGNIAPGLWMRAEALHTFTHRLPSVEVENPGSQVELWGTDTHSAIRSGVVRGVAAEVAYYRAMLTNPDNALVIITGGDARRVADMLPFDNNIVVDPLLVCKGLNSILKYNENL